MTYTIQQFGTYTGNYIKSFEYEDLKEAETAAEEMTNTAEPIDTLVVDDDGIVLEDFYWSDIGFDEDEDEVAEDLDWF